MIRLEHVRGPGQITDATLLALAVRHQARLVSFDRRLNWRSVVGARANSIVHP
jgi:predicted nucleic acid-binding protein